jgi:hypothetical protein
MNSVKMKVNYYSPRLNSTGSKYDYYTSLWWLLGSIHIPRHDIRSVAAVKSQCMFSWGMTRRECVTTRQDVSGRVFKAAE